jgi:hypothetical protein
VVVVAAGDMEPLPPMVAVPMEAAPMAVGHQRRPQRLVGQAAGSRAATGRGVASWRPRWCKWARRVWCWRPPCTGVGIGEAVAAAAVVVAEALSEAAPSVVGVEVGCGCAE